MASKTRPLLSMVALNAPKLPPIAEILEAFAKRYPADLAGVEVQEKNRAFVFPVADGTVAVALVPAPIPWSSLEGPCEAAWWWPEATERMRQHQAHAAVAMIDHSGTAVERHILLTQLAATVVAHCDVAGVYWSPGTVVHSPEAFLTLADALAPTNLLPELWIDMRLGENPDGTHRFFTTGMEAFGQREIEIQSSQRSAEEMLDFAYGVIRYVLLSDQAILEGETIGRSEEEKVAVSYEASMLDPDRKVMRLAFV